MRKGHHQHRAQDAYAYRSALESWNTTYKTMVSVMALCIVIGADQLSVSCMTIVFMAVLLVGVGRLPLTEYVHILLIPAVFILLGSVAILIQIGAVDNASHCLWAVRLGSVCVYVSEDSLRTTLHVISKAFGAVSALYLLTLSTAMGEILTVLRRLHIPGVLIDLMHLIYRYIFLLSEIHHRQREAAVARLGHEDFRVARRTFGSEMANLLVLSLRKSGAYYDAMESRGYEEAGLFWEEKKPWKAAHVAVGIVYLFLAAFLIFW